MTPAGRPVVVACLCGISILPGMLSAARLPVRVFASPEGLSADNVTCLHQDGDGRLWIGTAVGLSRFDGSRFVSYDVHDGLPHPVVNEVVQTPDGTVWVATPGGLTRMLRTRRADGTLFEPVSLPQGPRSARSLAVDGKGVLWVAVGDALWRRTDGDSGFQRIDPGIRWVEGRPRAVMVVRTGPDGSIWIGTSIGVQRVCPDGRTVAYTTGRKHDRHPVRILEVRFGAVCLGEGHRLSYRHALGTNGAQWSSGSPGGPVHLDGLAPGRYTLRLRAELPDGRSGPEASLNFVIPPPVWQRWWFRGTVFLVILGGAMFWHRARVRHLVEVQRVRERIASDLHDELGLSLSRISILSELARRDAEERGMPSGELLTIGETARSLIDATSDMVWALDPARDDLGSVLTRARRSAGDICGGTSVRLEVRIGEGLQELRLPAEVRRHLLLILKEALHNALRHGDPSVLILRASRTASWLLLSVEDDGTGFDPASPGVSEGEGHGLAGMTRRAREAGGSLSIVSAPGQGTTVTITLPLPGRGLQA